MTRRDGPAARRALAACGLWWLCASFAFGGEPAAEHERGPRSAAELIADGDEALAAGQAGEAARLYELAITSAPEDADARVRLARALAALDRRSEARARLEEALDLDPLHGAANSLKAAFFEGKGEETLAIGHYRAAVNADAGDLVSRGRLAVLLMRQESYAEAEAHFATIVKAQEASADAHYYLSLAAVAQGDCPKAMSAIGTASRLSPQDPRVLQTLSRVYATCPVATEEQQRESLAVARLLYDRYPGRHTAATLAMAMAAAGRYADAVEMQTQAIYEAIQAGDEWAQHAYYNDLQRYQSEQRATQAWSKGAAIFTPPLIDVPPGSQFAAGDQ
ncbi:hypothetical protein BH24PSE2_BH24PSE2_02580 [soil metagenome]